MPRGEGRSLISSSVRGRAGAGVTGFPGQRMSWSVECDARGVRVVQSVALLPDPA